MQRLLVGSVEPRTISVPLRDSADSEYNCLALKFCHVTLFNLTDIWLPCSFRDLGC
jgi:hypothetical protein